MIQFLCNHLPASWLLFFVHTVKTHLYIDITIMNLIIKRHSINLACTETYVFEILVGLKETSREICVLQNFPVPVMTSNLFYVILMPLYFLIWSSAVCLPFIHSLLWLILLMKENFNMYVNIYSPIPDFLNISDLAQWSQPLLLRSYHITSYHKKIRIQK